MAREGVLRFEYAGKLREIPYNFVEWRGDNYMVLTDKNRRTHDVYFEDGKWVLLWHERFPSDFNEILDWVIKQELGKK